VLTLLIVLAIVIGLWWLGDWIAVIYTVATIVVIVFRLTT
jgi:hypothetical protein